MMEAGIQQIDGVESASISFLTQSSPSAPPRADGTHPTGGGQDLPPDRNRIVGSACRWGAGEIGYDKETKRIAPGVAVSGLMLALGYLVPDGLSLYLFLPAYVLIGYDVLYHAGRNLFTGQLFDENFLMCLATVGALATGIIRKPCS